MKYRALLLVSVTVSQLFFTGCSKTNDAADAGSAINFQLQSINRIATLNQRVAQNATISWTAGSGFTTQIKFEAKSASNAEVEFKSQSQQRVDLIKDAASPLGTITLPGGIYSEVEFKIVLNKSQGEPALQLNGTFTSGTTNIPVVFTVNTETEIKAEKENVVVSDNSVYKSLTTLNLSLLTKGITETMLNSAPRTNGVIEISSASNTDIYNKLLLNLNDLDSSEFEHD